MPRRSSAPHLTSTLVARRPLEGLLGTVVAPEQFTLHDEGWRAEQAQALRFRGLGLETFLDLRGPRPGDRLVGFLPGGREGAPDVVGRADGPVLGPVKPERFFHEAGSPTFIGTDERKSCRGDHFLGRVSGRTRIGKAVL